MQKFMERLAEKLRSAGFDAKYDGWYLVVSGCKFDCDSRQSKKAKGATVVSFLDSKFKMAADGTFDEAKAIGLIVQELPKRLKKRDEAAALAKFHIRLKESGLKRNATGMYESADGLGLLDALPTGVRLSTVHASVEEALAALDRVYAPDGSPS